MLGSVQTANLAIQTGSIGLSTAGAIAAPSIASAVGLSTVVAVPIIGAAVAGITLAVTYLAQGCGATCTMTSNFVNQVEPYMKQNVAAWQASGKSCPKEPLISS